MLGINTEIQIPRLETRPEERNQDQEIQRKQDKRREIAEPRSEKSTREWRLREKENQGSSNWWYGKQLMRWYAELF